jgi:hypothetical protein
MRKYTLTTGDGEKVEQLAETPTDAIRLSGVTSLAASKSEPASLCGGDCGDCNEVRNCE